jgi:two-component system sensor histidine kinase GlrK
MGRLAGQGAQAVYRSVGVTQGSRILVENIIDLERKARQFDVLGDEHLLAEAVEKHGEIEKTLGQLLALPLEESQRNRLVGLQEEERKLIETLKDRPRGEQEWQAALKKFGELHVRAKNVHEESNGLIVHEVNAMQKAAEKAQKGLIGQAVALIPFTVLFVALFTHLISKPIQQIDLAIHRLGEGDFDSPLRVAGPRDLEFLGERLDWLRKQLGDVERAKGKFMAQVSHELKTPLASIREGTELLADEVVGSLNAQQLEISGILRKKSIKLQKLIENLLGFSKGQAKISPLHLSSLSLDQLVEEILANYKLVILKKNLTLDLALAPVNLQGDRERLMTVVDNLVSNAMKYTPAGGRIALTTGKDGAFAALDVSDSGPGIPSEEVDNIFEPFYQGRLSPSPGHIKGTGLGLSIAREFVFAHRGSLRLVDDSAGGAHFRVTLPLNEKGEIA